MQFESWPLHVDASPFEPEPWPAASPEPSLVALVGHGPIRGRYRGRARRLGGLQIPQEVARKCLISVCFASFCWLLLPF